MSKMVIWYGSANQHGVEFIIQEDGLWARYCGISSSWEKRKRHPDNEMILNAIEYILRAYNGEEVVTSQDELDWS